MKRKDDSRQLYMDEFLDVHRFCRFEDCRRPLLAIDSRDLGLCWQCRRVYERSQIWSVELFLKIVGRVERSEPRQTTVAK